MRFRRHDHRLTFDADREYARLLKDHVLGLEAGAPVEVHGREAALRLARRIAGSPQLYEEAACLAYPCVRIAVGDFTRDDVAPGEVLDSADLSDTDLRAFLVPRLAATAGFLSVGAGMYAELLARRERHGVSEALERESLALAADLAHLLASLRCRPELLYALGSVFPEPTLPLCELDQLFCSLVLLSGEGAVMRESDRRLSAQQVADWSRSGPVHEFVDRLGAAQVSAAAV